LKWNLQAGIHGAGDLAKPAADRRPAVRIAFRVPGRPSRGG